jgi:tetratricopeptide (TPR) repeat protein
LGAADFDTFFYLGNINEYNNSPESALHYYIKASEIDEKHIETLLKVGTLYLYENDFNKGLTYFQKVHSLNETNAFNINMLGLCLLNTVIYILILE